MKITMEGWQNKQKVDRRRKKWKAEYRRNRYKNMSEEDKQKLKEYGKKTIKTQEKWYCKQFIFLPIV